MDHRLPPIGTFVEYEGHLAEVKRHLVNKADMPGLELEYVEPRNMFIQGFGPARVVRSTMPLFHFLGEAHPALIHNELEYERVKVSRGNR